MTHFADMIMRWWRGLGITLPLQGFGAALLKDDPFGWHKAMLPVVLTAANPAPHELHRPGSARK